MTKPWKDYITELAELVSGDAGRLFEKAAAVMVNEQPDQKTVMVTFKDGSIMSIVIVPPNDKLKEVANNLLDNLKKETAH